MASLDLIKLGQYLAIKILSLAREIKELIILFPLSYLKILARQSSFPHSKAKVVYDTSARHFYALDHYPLFFLP
jgi:hypothetical protein